MSSICLPRIVFASDNVACDCAMCSDFRYKQRNGTEDGQEHVERFNVWQPWLK
jgi:hypothetical protein